MTSKCEIFLTSFVIYVCLFTVTDAIESKAIMPQMNWKRSLLNFQNVSLLCRQHFNQTIFSGTYWSIRMLDAMGKIPAGILEGSIMYYGSYDECIDTVAIEEVTGKKMFQGQYCMLDGKLPSFVKFPGLKENELESISIQWHGCFPSTCSEKDVTLLTNSALEMLQMNFSSAHCDVKTAVVVSGVQMFATFILSLLGFILLIGTTVDVFLRNCKPKSSQKGKTLQVLTSFSVYSNAIKLLDTNTSSEKLCVLNGLRFFSMAWVILGHTYEIDYHLFGNAMLLHEYSKGLLWQIIVNGILSVDIFFVISGLLVTYVTMNVYKKIGKINWCIFYLHRYLRLTPSLAFVILIVFLIPLFGSGPLWKIYWEKSDYTCRKNWWLDIFYINNVFATVRCIVVSWYLSVDFQFYIVTPPILYMLWRKPWIGILLIKFCLVATMITPAVLTTKNNYLPTFFIQSDEQRYTDYMNNIYTTPWCRMPPYCVGMFLGYLLSLDKKWKIHPVVQAILWILSSILSLTILFSTYYWNNGHESSTEFTFFYVATYHFLFSLGIAWLIFACSNGYGGIIKKILGAKMFVPLGRMTFMVFLLHWYVIRFLITRFTERIMISNVIMVYYYFGFILASYGVAFIATICIETPFINLEKFFIKQDTRSSKKDDSVPLLNDD